MDEGFCSPSLLQSNPTPIPSLSILSSSHASPKEAHRKGSELWGHCWARGRAAGEGVHNRSPQEPGLEGLRLLPHAGRCSVVVAASLPVPAATSQTKWRSAAAACRDGRATTPLAIAGGRGGSAACLSPVPQRPPARGCSGGCACLWGGTGDARPVPGPPRAVMLSHGTRAGRSAAHRGLQGRGHCPARGRRRRRRARRKQSSETMGQVQGCSLRAWMTKHGALDSLPTPGPAPSTASSHRTGPQ